MKNFKNYFSKFLKRKKIQTISDKDIQLRNSIQKIIQFGVTDLELYKEAFSLKSASKKSKNYERLEFLGDAILGSIISCHLYNLYPKENEGFLTQMKAKIVNRKNLNKLGENLGLRNFIQQNKLNKIALSENITGNLFEAFIGAIFLDCGYDVCNEIVLQRLLTPEEISKLENKIMSYKGLLLEWTQKKKSTISYETSEEILPNKSIVFRSIVQIDNRNISNATESSKKKAEEKAAQRAFYILNKKENILETHHKTIIR